MKKHLKTHSGEKVKQFSYKCGLKSHLKIHAIEKPFKCGICFEEFDQIFNLTMHLKMHGYKV